MVVQRLQNKVAIVTGGASPAGEIVGIGRATVQRLLEEGARVVIADINRNAGHQTVEELNAKGYGGQAAFQFCDVRSEHDIRQLVRFTVDTFGQLDCMVGCAGTGGAISQLVDTTVENWDKTQELILRSLFLCTKHAAKQMMRQADGGAIVNVASIAGISGDAGGAAYSAAKAGVINLTRCAAAQLASSRIRCNAVSPGNVITPLLARGGDLQPMFDAAVATQPWPEPALAHHIASVIAFLVSEDARMMTGENLVIDGGATSVGRALFTKENALGQAIMERIEAAGVKEFDTPQEQAAAATTATHQTDYTPRKVMVTGASRGMGYAIAKKLASLGHTIIGCARREETVRQLSAEFGPSHNFQCVDVTDDDAVREWSKRLSAAGLVPQLLLNNAGTPGRSAQMWRLTAAEFEDVLRVNVLGVANVIRHFVPPMLRLDQAVIVNFSSGWGRDSAEKVSAYCASKWGVEGLTQVLAKELPPKIAAVSLHPGIVHTKMLEETFGASASQYPSPGEWAESAAPFLLNLGPSDNGKQLTAPGASEFRGMG